MWLVADVYEADAPKIKIGQKVEVKTIAFPDETFEATVEYISPNVNPDTRRVGVRCVIAKPTHLFKTDMFAAFKIPTGAPETSPAVPVNSIVREGNSDVVYVA